MSGPNYRTDSFDRIRIREKDRAAREADQRPRRICSFCGSFLGWADPRFAPGMKTHGVCEPLCPKAKAMGWR